eukprot:TRINITY_DN5398_c0_g1_i9.p2 TRINITY_DN5398_c0_g1~~TRINITY_DN5398_c0_g1_i9.p2  ORF type:complete len:102 (-),score=24.47 TRINITY_DN5398_c0_g1_i9:155-460(-)
MEELVELRRYCRQLETQLKYTEFEKLKMTKEMIYMGNKEPTHPIFLETMPTFPVIGSASKKVKTARVLGLKARSKSRANMPTVRVRGGGILPSVDSDESAK